MKTQLFRLMWALSFSAMVLGCGGSNKGSTTEQLLSEEDDVDLVAHLTGIDDQTAVPDAEETDKEKPMEERAPAPVASGDYVGGSQGIFVGNLLLDGQDTKGTYTVRSTSGSGEVIKKDIPTGTEIRLDPGFYDFAFSTPKVVGRPEFMLRDVKIEAGQRTKKDVKMPVGKITLITGARCARKPIKIRAKGASDWFKGKFFTCVEMTLMAGEYEAEMRKGKTVTPISGIQVYDGGVRDVQIHAQ
jgi:hypothetical protein